ncbi:hypothetical protein [Priestia megaterium]|uniref:hypothetical protein n=1 Tax=Priestia megaterium TaxID=1404 RepID=UPI00211BD6D6|nr:hypothetical protein [Priestia megaterium]
MEIRVCTCESCEKLFKEADLKLYTTRRGLELKLCSDCWLEYKVVEKFLRKDPK